jgi:hypothetical protein
MTRNFPAKNQVSVIPKNHTYMNHNIGRDSITCGSIESSYVATRLANGEPLNDCQSNSVAMHRNSSEVKSKLHEQISEFFSLLEQISQSSLNSLALVEPASNSSNVINSKNLPPAIKKINFHNAKLTANATVPWSNILQGIPMIPLGQPTLENSAENCSGYVYINPLDILFNENA